MSTNIFPRNDYNVEVCAHRWNKQMTYVESTDTLSNNNYRPLMLWFFRNNIRAGIFSWITAEAQLKAAKELERCGIVNNSLYCTMGSTNQGTMNANARTMREIFKKFFARYPSTYSYQGSDETYYKAATSYFNAGRDNDYADFGHPYTFYGYDFQTQLLLGSLEVPSGGGSPVYPERTGFNRFDEMKHFMSMRIPSEVGNHGKYGHQYTWQEALELAIADFRTTYGNRGFYNNFCHWHDLGGGVKLDVTVLQYKDYIDALGGLTVNNVNVSDNIHFCGFDEAMEYMVARMMLKKISCYTPSDNPDEIHIVGYFNNNVSPRFRMDCINTPLTIKVDLTGTPLAGQTIAVNYGQVIGLGNNVFLVELPAPRNGNISGIVISKAEGGDYIRTAKPVVSGVVNDSNITFSSTNHRAENCHFVIFRKSENATEDAATIIQYDHGNQSVTIKKEDGYVYAAGVSANYGDGHYVVTALSEWL